MRYPIYPITAFLLLFGDVAFARPPAQPADTPDPAALIHQTFLREYVIGVQRLPMQGGRIYGWSLNDTVTFGRFKGESDEFGFSVELNARQRVEITTDGFRWRKAIGGGR
jgi:hypothetical protein